MAPQIYGGVDPRNAIMIAREKRAERDRDRAALLNLKSNAAQTRLKMDMDRLKREDQAASEKAARDERDAIRKAKEQQDEREAGAKEKLGKQLNDAVSGKPAPTTFVQPPKPEPMLQLPPGGMIGTPPVVPGSPALGSNLTGAAPAVNWAEIPTKWWEYQGPPESGNPPPSLAGTSELEPYSPPGEAGSIPAPSGQAVPQPAPPPQAAPAGSAPAPAGAPKGNAALHDRVAQLKLQSLKNVDAQITEARRKAAIYRQNTRAPGALAAAEVQDAKAQSLSQQRLNAVTNIEIERLTSHDAEEREQATEQVLGNLSLLAESTEDPAVIVAAGNKVLSRGDVPHAERHKITGAISGILSRMEAIKRSAGMSSPEYTAKVRKLAYENMLLGKLGTEQQMDIAAKKMKLALEKDARFKKQTLDQSAVQEAFDTNFPLQDITMRRARIKDIQARLVPIRTELTELAETLGLKEGQRVPGDLDTDDKRKFALLQNQMAVWQKEAEGDQRYLATARSSWVRMVSAGHMQPEMAKMLAPYYGWDEDFYDKSKKEGE